MNQKLISAINCYKTNGYGVLPNFISPSSCDRAIKQINRLIMQFNPKPEEVVAYSTEHDQYKKTDYYKTSYDQVRFFVEEKAYQNGKLVVPKLHSINKIGHGLHQKHQLFHQITYKKEVLQICQQCGVPDPLVMQTMVLIKPPKVGARVVIHQDATFLYDQQPSLMGFWVPFVDVSTKNGCLWGLDGSHKGKLYHRSVMNWKDNRAQYKQLHDIDYKQSDFKPIEIKKGDLLFFSGLFLHKSQINTTNEPRYAFTWHLKEKSIPWPKDNWLQRDKFSTFQYKSYQI